MTASKSSSAAVEGLRRASEPAWTGVVNHSFVNALATGEVSRNAFRAYLIQDTLYLRSYVDACLFLAARWPDPADKLLLMEAARLSAVEEQDLHDRLGQTLGFDSNEVAMAEPGLENLAYQNHLLASVAFGSCVEGLAALTPCNWLYASIGEQILGRVGEKLSEHPYQEWVQLYSDPAVAGQSQKLCACLEAEWQRTHEPLRRRAQRAFVRSVHHELAFLDMVARLL
jgi:thiaminase/transcriptional activator TenA